MMQFHEYMERESLIVMLRRKDIFGDAECMMTIIS